MRLVVGLGNPGIQYAMTRHNIGFMVVDHLLNKIDLGTERQGFSGVYYKGKINGEDVIILKPHTYMNNSGLSVRQIVDYFKIDINDILVINDDLELPTGYFRLREHCHSGGHNGIKSIDAHLGTDMYKRLRVGIGKDVNIPVVDYVLGKLTEEEKPLIKEAIEVAANAVNDWFAMPFDRVMNKYNKKMNEASDK